MKKKILIFIIVVFTLISFQKVYSVEFYETPKIENFRLAEGKSINISGNGDHFVNVTWSNSSLPDSNNESHYINIYYNKVNKQYSQPQEEVIAATSLPRNINSYTISQLDSGTIYYIHAKAYYDFELNEITYTSSFSEDSEDIKVLTDINIEAFPEKNEKIKIVWDDVWDVGKRISYKLYISDNPYYNNTTPIYFSQSDIGPDKTVKINEVDGKLEYSHQVEDKGKIYYIKILPLVDSQTEKNPGSETCAASYMKTNISKENGNDYIEEWRINWEDIVVDIDEDYSVNYQIYRGIVGEKGNERFLTSVETNWLNVTLSKSDEINYYYYIKAKILRDGISYLSNIDIRSENIILEEEEIHIKPVVPEIVESFERISGDTDTTIISYTKELTPTGSTIIWKVPRKGNGEIDTEIVYDIWLITNPEQLDHPPIGYLKERNFIPDSGNYIVNDSKIEGYKYKMTDLLPNSTYYFKIIAKRIYSDDGVEEIVYTSDPAFKVIVTPPKDEINTPISMNTPPFSVKKFYTENENMLKQVITTNSITLQVKDRWYEKYNYKNSVNENLNEGWYYIKTEKIYENDKNFTTIYNNAEEGEPYLDNINYRAVEYDDSINIEIEYIEFFEGIDFKNVQKYATNKIKNISLNKNDINEKVEFNLDGNKHNTDINISGLKPNTTYVFWARAMRKGLNLYSEYSQPIIVTTSTDYTIPAVKPVAPENIIAIPGDTFVDLIWDRKKNIEYIIQYGLSNFDNTNYTSIKVKSEELELFDYYRIGNLMQNTEYFFWVKAISGTQESQWSDSVPIKTLPYNLPDYPKGFGIKNSDDAITKNTITYEWNLEKGFSYIIEISEYENFYDSKKYEAGSSYDYTIRDLYSNKKYYARLFSKSIESNYLSKASETVIVKTLRSNDDYDTDKDIEQIDNGIYIEYSYADENTLNINIEKSRANNFIEQLKNDFYSDYAINIDKTIENVNITLPGMVLYSLDKIKENISINSPENILIIKPGSILQENDYHAFKNSLINININYSFKNEYDNYIKFKIFEKNSFGEEKEITKLKRALKVVFKFSGIGWYDSKTTEIIETSTGNKFDFIVKYLADKNESIAIYETGKTGEYYIYNNTKNSYKGSSKYKESINELFENYDIKSIENENFNPDSKINLEECIKIVFDLLNYDYSNDFMEKAHKAGLIEIQDINNNTDKVSREKGIYIGGKFYELVNKTSVVEETISFKFNDIANIEREHFKYIIFAINNKIISEISELNMSEKISFGEYLYIIENYINLS